MSYGRKKSDSRGGKNGLTVIEVLVATGITLALLLTALPFYGGLPSSAQLDALGSGLVQEVRLVREQARAGLGNAAHGIKFFEDRYVIFEGSSYAARKTELDRITAFPPDLVLVSTFPGGELVFAAGSGIPASPGTVTLDGASRSRVVTVNGAGMAEEQ
jgi:hypothetical protein